MRMSPESPDSSRRDWKEILSRERRVRQLQRFETLLASFSPAERLILYVLSCILAVSAFSLAVFASRTISTEIPSAGGGLVEGEIAPVRFINPILTLSQADNDLAALVYSGLMRAEPDGSYVPDLAQSYSVSADGTTYTFTLRPNVTFQDGTPVTSQDVAFTVGLAQNPDIKSPLRADWDGVQVSTPDDRTVIFTLPHAYAPFLENTTLGILPKHLWQNVSAEEFPFSPLNMHPIGSGPYRVADFSTDSTGSATRYNFVPFDNFALGTPYLHNITFVFYPNQTAEIAAFNARQIDAIAGISADQVAALKRSDAQILDVPLPRTFGIFFNQTHAPVLQDSSVRAALDAAVDKQRLVNAVLAGYGQPLSGPIPPGVLGAPPQLTVASLPISGATSSALGQSASGGSAINNDNIDAAHAILVKGGWNFDKTASVWKKGKQTLSFTLATADEPELVATAQALAGVYQALGVQVQVQVYPLSQFNTDVLRPRQYDAVLFGEVVGRSLDLFAFWHSSQRDDPGLNLAMYANSKSDALLSQARATTDPDTRDALYSQFQSILEKDDPAVFLYAPDFLYVLPKNIQGVTLGALTDSSERFLTVYQWYTETQNVWNFLVKQQ
jgi:peptide/nickel transport system substrate-binding protein